MSSIQYLSTDVILRMISEIEENTHGEEMHDARVCIETCNEVDGLVLSVVFHWSSNSGYVNTYYTHAELISELTRRNGEIK